MGVPRHFPPPDSRRGAPELPSLPGPRTFPRAGGSGRKGSSSTGGRHAPRTIGVVTSRDGAYHQGTVWLWLLGPFVEARFKANGVARSGRVAKMRIGDGTRLKTNNGDAPGKTVAKKFLH